MLTMRVQERRKRIGSPRSVLWGLSVWSAGFTIRRTHSFTGETLVMRQRAFVRVAALGLLPLICASFGFSQQKGKNSESAIDTESACATNSRR